MKIFGVGLAVCACLLSLSARSQDALELAVKHGSEMANSCLKIANASYPAQFSGSIRKYFLTCVEQDINDSQNPSARFTNAGLLLTSYYFGKREWLDRIKVGKGMSALDVKEINSWLDWAIAIGHDHGIKPTDLCALADYVDCGKLATEFDKRLSTR